MLVGWVSRGIRKGVCARGQVRMRVRVRECNYRGWKQVWPRGARLGRLDLCDLLVSLLIHGVLPKCGLFWLASHYEREIVFERGDLPTQTGMRLKTRGNADKPPCSEVPGHSFVQLLASNLDAICIWDDKVACVGCVVNLSTGSPQI